MAIKYGHLRSLRKYTRHCGSQTGTQQITFLILQLRLHTASPSIAFSDNLQSHLFPLNMQDIFLYVFVISFTAWARKALSPLFTPALLASFKFYIHIKVMFVNKTSVAPDFCFSPSKRIHDKFHRCHIILSPITKQPAV